MEISGRCKPLSASKCIGYHSWQKHEEDEVTIDTYTLLHSD